MSGTRGSTGQRSIRHNNTTSVASVVGCELCLLGRHWREGRCHHGTRTRHIGISISFSIWTLVYKHWYCWMQHCRGILAPVSALCMLYMYWVLKNTFCFGLRISSLMPWNVMVLFKLYKYQVVSCDMYIMSSFISNKTFEFWWYLGLNKHFSIGISSQGW